MAQIRYTVHMVMVDIDNPPHTLLSQCWDSRLPVLSVVDVGIQDYSELGFFAFGIFCFLPKYFYHL